ncbi:lysophospholipid acyltransferase family protein [Alteromonas pelagimontana]|uniref:L-ornithine N(alpha)-acyltransferase n=1 Tax=Alteromonas pelagimontana TaxID=1858656 RepID=A0A6M4MG24_9ALTE|nr:lysophospholipid acyltransferase family protein [Alteromonas pelagimontana]QJR82069.1 lysophospholipid acyltransferase family protein [Alteromonas pelagimontana]
MFTVDEVLNKHYPQVSNNPVLFKSLSFVLRHLLHEREMNEFKDAYPHYKDIDFVEQVLEYFTVSYSTRDVEKERIPSAGRVVIIANHPIGSLDGLALIKLISEVRSDIKVVANQMLMAIEPLQNILLPVNNMQGGTPKQHLEAIQRHLHLEGALLIFPAGEVSRLRPQGVRDTTWNSGFLRIARLAKAPILPVYIDAKNSSLFYGLSMIYKPLATAMLVKEMFRKHQSHLPIRIGELIPAQVYQPLALPIAAQVKLFKRHLYRIGHSKKGLLTTQAAIAPPEDRRELSKAIRQQCEHLGHTADGKHIFLYQHTHCSPIMREIGRQREIAFRAVGEGTNKRRDIDAYDAYYYHLILWDENDLEIVGAYRFGDAEQLAAPTHPTGLYSATLFNYSQQNDRLFSQGLELGRSFVQPAYWGKRSLDYLWFGIGAFLARYPKYRYLFGAVSISNAYPKPAQDLLVQFYRTYYPAKFAEARSRLPYQGNGDTLQRFVGNNYKKEFTLLKHLLANMGVNVPTLYKQYTEICHEGGAAFIDFNVDPDFNNCIDGLIVVDMHQLTAKKKKRYLQDCNMTKTA